MSDPSPHQQIARRILGNIAQASAPSVSPDGRHVAFVMSRVDLDENTYVSQVWMAATDGSDTPRPLTAGPRDSQPTWSPDGTSLSFVSRRNSAKTSDTTVHVMPITVPGEIRTVASMPDAVMSPMFSPNGRWLAFIARTPDPRYSAKGADTGDTSWQAPRKIDRFFSRLDSEGWIVDRPSHVYVVPADGTAPVRNLTPGEFQHHGFEWLPDGTTIVVAAARHDTWDLDFAVSLYTVTLDGPVDGPVNPLTDTSGLHGYPAASPNGRIAVIGHDDSQTYPQNCRVGVLDANTPARPAWLTGQLDRSFEPSAGVGAPMWTTETTLLATVEDRGHVQLCEVFTDGHAPRVITSGDHTIKSFDHRNGVTCVAVSGVDSVTDIAAVAADGSLIPITRFADTYRSVAAPLPWERFAAPCTDGTAEIDAWIMRPANFDPDASYPVLLNVHGGPHTQYGETFFDEAQMQAAAGFVVVMCNPRGSSGREESWGQAIMGPKHPTRPGSGWGSVDVDDVLAALDTALTRYTFCDPARVGMLGGSYGGYMATWLAGAHGDRFAAICTERSVNNLLTEEWTSDIATGFRAEHGPIHLDDPNEYLRLSPISFVDNIRTPILIIHSEDDLRCPISQAEELFVALRLRGRDVTFYRFPGESHELSRSGSPVHRMQRAEIILDWFSERLR